MSFLTEEKGWWANKSKERRGEADQILCTLNNVVKETVLQTSKVHEKPLCLDYYTGTMYKWFIKGRKNDGGRKEERGG